MLSSSATTSGDSPGRIYTPLTPAAMLPQLSGTSGITATGLHVPYNLLKVSSPSQLFYSGLSTGTIPSSRHEQCHCGLLDHSLPERTVLSPRLTGTQHYLLPTTSSTRLDAVTPVPSSRPPGCSWRATARTRPHSARACWLREQPRRRAIRLRDLPRRGPARRQCGGIPSTTERAANSPTSPRWLMPTSPNCPRAHRIHDPHEHPNV